ncbi:SDR family oxidoreductase [Paracoccus xiamenensis]|uniref:SDR family oxidoreductase n=1 Tax=Paracoccus xiamenensis TaxID=2714901 RepID=UPI001409C0F8|nr:SDR family oxidoreductase [Paracoccus xiamenensis]NHF71590.1 SDR family oxidoreductase [Paracoccus xiamenensis]
MTGVFIIGGAGGVGRRLGPILAAGGKGVAAMARRPEQLEPQRASGVTPVTGDLLGLDAAGLSALMTGCDTVVFSAGAGGKGGPEMTRAVDGDGLEKAVSAAKGAGIRRFLLVSVFPDALRGQPAPNDRFELYMQVKRKADVHLADSGLDWVILRPGTLTDQPGTGKVRAGAAVPYGEVSRDNVATVLAEIVATPGLNRRIIEVTDGDTPAAQAVGALVN